MAAWLSDGQYCRALLRFEGALAEVQGALSIIPAWAADKISRVCGELAGKQIPIEPSILAAGVQRDGVPTISLVAALRQAVGEQAAPYVHWGATSQDAMDTAMLLQLRPVVRHIESQLRAVARQLSSLADSHRRTVMVARTHGQQAVPTSFGLKAAGWLAPLLRHIERLKQLESRLWQLQLAGAAGTLASLGNAAPAVRQGLATALQLPLGNMSWHAQRDNLVELGNWMSLVCGALAKIAQDIVLLVQSEVAEAQESAPGTRGGSSCMPQKNNPMRCEQVIAATRTATAHLGALHAALIVEHERATHGWQVEWLNLPPLVALTAGALANTQAILADLVVAPKQMLHNLERNGYLALAERLTVVLGSVIPRLEAQAMVKKAALQALSQSRSLVDVLRENIAGNNIAGDKIVGNNCADSGVASFDWQQLADPAEALGQSSAFIDAVLQHSQAILD